MSQVVVFDFDKTLTNRDTLFGFYREVDQNNLSFPFKRLLIAGAAVLYKLKMLSNNQLKRIGVHLFLSGKKQDVIIRAAQSYAKKIKFSDLYYKEFLKTEAKERIVISASYEVYLKELFPNDRIVGTSINYNNGRASSVKINMYGSAKKEYLVQNGVDQIDRLYTDSFSDKPLMKMAKETFIIKDGHIVQILNGK